MRHKCICIAFLYQKEEKDITEPSNIVLRIVI